MTAIEKILSGIGIKRDRPAPLRRADSETDPVFVCDVDNRRGVLRLRNGKWADRILVVRLHCCEGPLCGCANVDFYCIEDKDLESESGEILHFSLDPMECKAARGKRPSETPYASDLAKAVVAEFGEKEWGSLRGFLLTIKREAVRTMDVHELSLPDVPYDIIKDGGMIGFAEIFPFADCFEFELDDRHWAVDDQYCVMPDCDCNDVALSFMDLTQVSKDPDAVRDPTTVVRYDYKRNRATVESRPAAGSPSIKDFMNALRKAHPSLPGYFRHRHKQLKTLFRQTLAEKAGIFGDPGIPIERPAPKVGRNDPCPCGSGKKYKRCCAT